MKIARLHNNGKLLIKGEVIEKDKEIITPYLEFSGSGSATVPHNNIFNITDAITISARIKITDTSEISYGQFMTKGNAFAGFLGVRRRDGFTLWNSTINGGLANNWVLGIFPELVDGEWHNIVFSYDKNAGENNQRFYIDGVLKNQKTTTGIFDISTNPLNLVTSSFKGGFRDARIYNRQLTDNEVVGLFEEKSVTDGLVGHWDMNESIGNITYDSSPNNNNGEIVGALWKEDIEQVDKISQLMPNGDLIVYGKLVEGIVPLPPEDEIWIYGTFTTTYEVGQLLGGWGSNVRVVDFYYDDDHYVIKASGTNLGETFCRVFNTNGNTVIFGSRFSLKNAYQNAPNATFIILNNSVAIRTKDWYMSAKKIYVPDNLVETYKAQTSAISIIGEVLPLSNYTAIMPKMTPDGTLVLGELIENSNLE